MSLRVFHLIFVTISTLVSVLVGVWGYWFGRPAVGAVGFLGAIWLPYYGVRIYAKLFGGDRNHVR